MTIKIKNIHMQNKTQMSSAETIVVLPLSRQNLVNMPNYPNSLSLLYLSKLRKLKFMFHDYLSNSEICDSWN